MKSADLELDFAVPTKEDFKYNRRRHESLSVDDYQEFIAIGIKMNPDIDKLRKERMKSGPKIPFEID